jgi:FtsZ-binding cell division protein ZapB
MELTALTTRVDVLSQRFESHSDETNSNFATRDKAVGEADRRAHSFRHEYSTSVGGLKGDLKAFKGDVSDRFRDVSNKFESVYADLGRWSEKHEALERSVLPELATFRDFEATTKKCIAEAKTKLAVLEARDPVGPLFVRLEQHEARLKGQDETASSTRADVARSFERITSLSAEAGQFREIVDALRQDVDHLRLTVNMLSNRVESEARERIDRQNRTLAGRLSRWIERIRTGTRAGWILIRSVGRS